MGSDITLPAVAKLGFSFNPRSRMGSDEAEAEKAEAEASFNPRSRMGSDGHIFCGTDHHACFNPRSRMGSDTLVESYAMSRRVSIHAPAWGATVSRYERPII